MKKNKSELTFKEFAENLGYIKVIWNGKVVYDDEFGDGTLEELENFQLKYDNKIIYSGRFIVEDFHHIILDLKGENKTDEN